MSRGRALVGPFVVAVVCAVPLGLWLGSRPAFAPAAVGLRSAAVAVALPGFASFALNLVLGARLRAIEPFFGGLDRLYRFHRRLGTAVAFAFVLHGGLVAAALSAPSLPGAVRLLVLGQGWKVTLGLLSALLLAAAVLIARYLPVEHPTFVWVQRCMGPIFGLGATHALLVPTSVPTPPALRTYLLVLSGAGGAAYLYRSVLGRIAVPRRPYRVEAVNHLAPDVTELVFAPLDRPLRHRAGQFAFVTFSSYPGRETHPFSIASAPTEPNLRMVVKALGRCTSRIQSFEPGGDVLIEGPYGGFVPHDKTRTRQVWIAGGIGVTPFLSATRSLESLPEFREIDLYYCTELAQEAYCLDELFAIADLYPTLRVIPIRKSDLGYITADDVDGASHVRQGNEIFICGPPPMMRSLDKQFRVLGVDRRKIHFEDFSFV